MFKVIILFLSVIITPGLLFAAEPKANKIKTNTTAFNNNLGAGDTTHRPDGLYVNYKLVNKNAIVADFCSAKGNQGDTIEFVQNGKVQLSRRIWN